MQIYSRPVIELNSEEREILHKCNDVICHLVEMLNGTDDAIAEPAWELIEERMEILSWNNWYDSFEKLVEVLTEN